MGDPSDEVRNYIILGLATKLSEIGPDIVDLLGSKNDKEWRASVEVVKHSSDDAIPKFIDFLARTAAGQPALATLVWQRISEVLTKKILEGLKRGDARSQLIRSASALFQRLGAPVLLPLIRQLAPENGDFVSLITNAVVVVGDSASIPALLQCGIRLDAGSRAEVANAVGRLWRLGDVSIQGLDPEDLSGNVLVLLAETGRPEILADVMRVGGAPLMENLLFAIYSSQGWKNGFKVSVFESWKGIDEESALVLVELLFVILRDSGIGLRAVAGKTVGILWEKGAFGAILRLLELPGASDELLAPLAVVGNASLVVELSQASGQDLVGRIRALRSAPDDLVSMGATRILDDLELMEGE